MKRASVTMATLAPALAKRTRKTDTCWVWTGMMKDTGYGKLRVDGKEQGAHRLALLAVGRAIPDGMMVDHLCRNRACVNPDHLRIVDPRTNTIENSESIAAKNAAKTHCKNGHALTAENTYISFSKGTRSRDCIACKRAAKARYEERQRARRSCDPCTCGGRGLCRDAA